MDTPRDRGRALEERVAIHFGEHGYRTTLNVVREGRSGARHEIDVLAVKDDPLTTYRVAVECKAWSSPIEKDVVTKLDYVKRDLGLGKGIVISMAGCRSGAQQAAEQLGIELWGTEEVRQRLGAAALAGTRPGQPALTGLGLPAKVGPEEADRILKKAVKGLLGSRESLSWSSLVWVPAFEAELALTQTEGRVRHRTVATRSWNLYEATRWRTAGRSLGAAEVRGSRPGPRLSSSPDQGHQDRFGHNQGRRATAVCVIGVCDRPPHRGRQRSWHPPAR